LDKFDICIVGAGVVGLSIAYELSKRVKGSCNKIVILEQESSFGQHTSSRNSEVIHAGIYYATGTLKAKLCLSGKELLYQHCKRFNIGHKRIEKLIVAQDGDQNNLQAIKIKAEENGVDDLRWIEARELQLIEPAVRAQSALLSPSTGIIDSHGYMKSLLTLAEQQGVIFAPRTKVESIIPQDRGFDVVTDISNGNLVESYALHCDRLINAAGLEAQTVASSVESYLQSQIPSLHLCKGDYFSYSGKCPFQRLIYPMPPANTKGLGIHATIDLAGQLRFGPDTAYIDEVNYNMDPAKAEMFADVIADYFPTIQANQLQPAYSGIRPKIVADGMPAGDFVIQRGEKFGMNGLLQLFGMESPALTASLSIAKLVADSLEI
jgi:L-2-hydroxyglutarate oxidase LhgO